MKYVILSLFIVLLISCNQNATTTPKDENQLTKTEELAIESKISKFKESQYTQYKLDSINEIFEVRIKLTSTTDLSKSTIEEHAKIHMDNWVANVYNKPYKIEKDYKLNLKSYLDYCKTMHLEPKTYIDILLK